ncbi:MAG: TylF/MycF family methyltransferase [Nitrospinota bacterium]|nr:TylF/MycF family methyltransferase [Nitrospinota bacterium]
MSSDPNEAKVRQKLLAGKATLDEGLKLYNDMTARGEDFPLNLEEAILKLGLEADPTRTDMITRLRYVLISQQKQVPDDIERKFAEHVRKEEWGTDHQKAAFEYHKKTGLNDMEPAFLDIYEKSKTFSMTSAERMYALYQAVRYLNAANIEGDIVECGVWRGGSMMIVANTLLAENVSDRNLYLFDTFEGLPRPDEQVDIDIWGNRAIDGWLPKSSGDDEKSHWAEASIEDVQANMLSTGYPQEHIRYVKGMVERTIPDEAPEKISLLRLDTDWYQSTVHELEHLFDRITSGGVLIIDDYGQFLGAKKAVDEFISNRKIPILLNRIDFSGRMAIKL